MDFLKTENVVLDSSTSHKIVRIGVLGGIGPQATAEFYSKPDFPQIIINSIPAPELDGIKYSKLTNKDINDISDSKYIRRDVQVILACTELALMLGNEKISKINMIDILVDATVNKFLSLKYAGGKELTNQKITRRRLKSR